MRLVFESVVRQCMEAELVGGEGFAVDASVIEADVSRYQRVEGSLDMNGCLLYHGLVGIFVGRRRCLT